MRVYDANYGKLLDTIYVRSSGEWFLEVEPGNVYGAFEILDSTLILGNDTVWDEWWGGDMSWWDWFFGFWYWESEEYRGCGWDTESCYDPDAAAEEQARICTNLTLLKQVINMLVIADNLLVRTADSDAENTTVQNASYEDEYMYHLKWAQRYWWRGYDNYKKGRPHRAINDFKKAWKYDIIAMKWALKDPSDPEPGSDMHDPCANCTHGCGEQECETMIKQPWWMYWYYSWCNECHFRCCTSYDRCYWSWE